MKYTTDIEALMESLTEEELHKCLYLLSLTKEVHCFEFEGLLILGCRVEIIKKYFKEKPSSKFRTWLIDNNLVLNRE